LPVAWFPPYKNRLH